MKDKNKTVALFMLALLLYVLFVWAGLQAVPTSSIQINNALSQLTNVGNAQKKTDAAISFEFTIKTDASKQKHQSFRQNISV